MKTYLLLFAVMASIICSCHKETINATTAAAPDVRKATAPQTINYLIKKGNHYAEQSQLEYIPANAIKCQVIFDSSAIYSSTNLTNQGDVNKLIGFSDCNTDHHTNSARIGWSWNGKEVILYAYAYVNKKRIIQTLGGVAINKSINCSLIAGDNHYYFKAGAYSDSILRNCTGNNYNRYKLFPYFGGDETAPHDIRIAILEQ